MIVKRTKNFTITAINKAGQSMIQPNLKTWNGLRTAINSGNYKKLTTNKVPNVGLRANRSPNKILGLNLSKWRQKPKIPVSTPTLPATQPTAMVRRPAVFS